MENSWAIALCSRFLRDRGYNTTAEMLAVEAGSEYLNAVLPTDKPLIAILEEWNQTNLQNSVARLSMDNEPNSLLDSITASAFPLTLQSRTYEGIHHLNIISVVACTLPRSVVEASASGFFSALITGSADATVRVTDATSGQVLTILSHQESAVLAIDQHPLYPHLILTAGMNGMHHIVDLEKGLPIVSQKNHGKYVVRAQFSPDGKWYVTASYDCTINIYEMDSNTGFPIKFTMTFRTAVESICFVESDEGFSLVMGTREDNYLHYIKLDSQLNFPYTKYNMNINGDDWVSFSAMELVASPSRKHVLVYTDSSAGRLIVYKAHSNTQVQNLYGTLIDGFSQPRACWHPSGAFVYATSDDHKIYVFDVVSGSIVAKLSGHEGVVRGLSFDKDTGKLYSCGFDKSVRQWSTESE